MANYSIAYDITADTSGFTKSLNDLSSKTKGFFSSLKNGINDFTDGLGSMGSKVKSFTSEGATAFKNFSHEGSTAFKEIVQSVSDTAEMLSPQGMLASGLSDIIGLLQKLGDEFDNLKARMVQLTGAEGIGGLEDSLKNVLGTGVAQSASTIAETLAVVHKSFDVTDDSLERLTKKFADFSHVTGADIPESVRKVSEAIKKWGLSTNEASGILEKLTYASQHSNASVSELLTGLTNGQAILSQFDMSINDSIAFLAKLSDNGIKVNTTLWGMRQALSEFSKSGINAAEGLESITNQIQNATTQTEALNIAVDVFGTKAGAELVQVLKKGNDEIADFTKELVNAHDVIREDEEEMETLTVMFEKMVNSIKSTFGELGEGVNSVVKAMVEEIMLLVEALSLLKPLFDTLGLIIKSVIYPIRELTDGFRDFIKYIKETTDSQYEMKKATEYATEVLELQRVKVDELTTSIKKMDETEKNRQKASLGSSILWAKGEVEKDKKNIDEIEAKMKKLHAQMEEKEKSGVLGLGGNILDRQEYDRLAVELDKANAKLVENQAILDSLQAQYKVFTDDEAETAVNVANTVADFVSSLGKVIDNSEERLLRQRVSMLEDEKKNEITRLQNLEASEDELLVKRDEYNEKIKAANLDLINFLNEKDKEEFINKIANAEKISVEEAAILAKDEVNHKEYYKVLKNIDTYYQNERARNEEGTLERVKAIGQEEVIIATEYQKKLLQQQIDYNNKIMANDVIRAENEGKTQEEINAIKKKYNDINIELLEEYYGILKKEALQGVTDAEELARIETYWDNELAYAKIENVEKVRKVLEKQKQEDYTWQIRLLQLNLEEATRDKDRIEIQAQILDLQRKQALATADEADIKRINEYYDRKILALYEGQEKALEALEEEQGDILDNTEKNYTWQQKLLTQNQRGFQLVMDQLVKEAELAGKSEEEIYAIKEKYLRKIEFEQVKQLDLEKEIALAKEVGAEEAAEIEAWYENERYLLALETENKIRALRKATNSPDESKSDEINAREEALEAIYELEESWKDKSTKQRISQLEYLRKVELEIAEENGWTQEQIYESQANYIDQITELKRKQLYKERDEALINARAIMEENLRVEGLTNAEKEKMADDYNNAVRTIREYYTAQENELELKATRDKNSYRLKEEESFWEKVKGFMSDLMPDFGSDFNAIFNGLREIGESLMNSVFPKFSEFFDSLDDKIKDFVDSLPEWAKSIVTTVGKIIKNFAPMAKAMINIALNSFRVLFDSTKKIFTAGFNLLKKISELNLDDILVSVLKFEDGVLTFFIQTIHELPNFVYAVMESVYKMFDTINRLDWGVIGKTLENSLVTFIANLPYIIEQIFTFFNNMLNMIKNMDWNSIFSLLGNAIESFFEELPSTLNNLLDTLATALNGMIESDFIGKVFGGMADAIEKFLEDPEHLKNFVDSLISVLSSIAKELPRLVIAIINLIGEALKTILQNPQELAELVSALLLGITQMAKALISNIGAVVGAFIPFVVDLIIEIIKKLPDMVGEIVSAVGNALWEFIKGLFTGGGSGGSSKSRDFGASYWDNGYDFGDVTKTVFSAVGDAVGTAWDWITGLFADGTNAAPRGLAVVGEAGPELVNFRGGEQVLNARNTQKLLSESGGNTNNWNITFNNLQDTTAYEMMRQLKQYDREMAINSVL